MDEFLTSKGFYNSGGCGCTPKKYKWRNDALPQYVFKVVPTRDMWYLLEHDHQIAQGQSVSLETQYNKYIQQ